MLLERAVEREEDVETMRRPRGSRGGKGQTGCQDRPGQKCDILSHVSVAAC